MTRRVVWSPLALADVEEIRTYLRREAGPRISARIVSEIRDLADGLAERAFEWEARDELAPGLRRALCVPYGIYYRVSDDRVSIARVLHGARDLPALFGQRG